MSESCASLTLHDPEAGWRILASLEEPYMLRREGTRLRAYLAFTHWHRASRQDPTESIQTLFEPAPPTGLSFSGWVGFWSYDFLAAQIGLSLHSQPDLPVPDGLFARPSALLDITATETRIEAVTGAQAEQLAKLASRPLPSPQATTSAPFSCNLDFDTYRDIFHTAREHILDGDTYQIKISQRYHSTQRHDPLHTFRKLDTRNPSPEAFLLHTPEFSLVSCSPETVIDLQGRCLITRPIGGTWERHGNEENADTKAFTQNEKELSEHNMLVDLERNDLARVCQPGTVAITHYRAVERYAHLYHLVSTIQGTLRAHTTGEDIITSLLPGGSITGCPKWRTMELINQYEPTARGVYTGSFGTIEDGGDMHFNLIIRTLLLLESGSYAQAGGGIVIDSTPEYEYNENALKARALLEACS